MSMSERLKKARKRNRMSQEKLAQTIGISRGVITNIEYGKIQEPSPLVIDAIAQALKIKKEWLLTGQGEMDDEGDALQSARLLTELYDVVKELSEDEQLYILDSIKALKTRLGKKD